MLPVANLRELYRRETGCSSSELGRDPRLQEAFCKLSKNDCIRLVLRGLHPSTLNGRWYRAVVDLRPDKVVLFEPRHVDFQDLVVALSIFENISAFEAYVRYFQGAILRSGDATLIRKCLRYMNVNIMDLFAVDLFSEEDAEHVYDNLRIDGEAERDAASALIHGSDSRDFLYGRHEFNPDFLTSMFYLHGVIPVNCGIHAISDTKFFIDVLSATRIERETFFILSHASLTVREDTALQDFVIYLISRGYNLRSYSWYAKRHLKHREEDMGIYANVFFDSRLKLCDFTMTDEVLNVACEFVDRYLDSIEYLVSALLASGRYDLLATILKHVPERFCTEDFYINLIREASSRPRVADFRVHSECLLLMCHMRKYPDVVDFAAGLPVSVFARHGINPFTDYCFSTNWFNVSEELLYLFVRFYGYDGNMMRKLLFEYPITESATVYVLTIMETNPGMSLFDPRHMCTMGYLLHTTYRLNFKPLETMIRLEKTRVCPDKISDVFESVHCYAFGVAAQVYSYVPLESYPVNKLTYAEDDGLALLQYAALGDTPDSETERLIAQMGDLGKLAHHGLFCFMDRYLGGWTPLEPLLRNADPTDVQPHEILLSSVGPLEVVEFVRYEDLAQKFADRYRTERLPSSYHVAYSCLFSYLMVYLLVGTANCLDSEHQAPDFVRVLINSLLKGLKVNDKISNISTELQQEIKNLRESVNTGCESGSGFRISVSLSHVVSLCRSVCVSIVLHNNQHNKF
ncbi:IEV morphogenesis [Western grey kangaroopox virus]|uniref:IEV morphogenesis n=1 Tax=Western grey kangaroopox virus TaxID=1566307 RepID=A0A2C9DSJ2_9POXV|nr:IEV morphogenesis [Western grey kangaroopox virus]ATI20975.1 IEV morphogenesis [Western grey kangaroopox virus]